MKNSWQQKQIGDLCEVIAGQSPEGKFYNAEGKGMPFYQGKKDFGEKFIEAPTTWTTQGTKIAQEGDILMSVRAPVGPVNFATEEACIGRGLAAIRSGTELNRDFLFYQLLHLQPTIAGREGAVFASINKSEIEALPLACAALPEQQRIVGILDEAFERIAQACANAEKNLQNARDLFESYLQSVFTQRGPEWVEKTLSEVAREFGRGKSKHRPRGDPKLLGGRYPLIQTGDIANAKHYITTYSQTYNEVGLAQSKLWPRGTVCIAIVGANVAETAILDFKSCFPDSVIGLVVDDQQADAEYVQFVLSFFKAFLKEKGKGTARDNINIGTFESQRFPFPGVAMQKKIVAKLNALAIESQRLASLYERKLAELKALKGSLLHQAFTGIL
jgi:type I restriction enzyme S subunit